jgi:hypothetical protein
MAACVKRKTSGVIFWQDALQNTVFNLMCDLSVLKKEEMIKDGLSAPLHRGAIKYYKEAGLM